MSRPLHGKRVAILVTDGFEQAELTGPKEALEKAGAQVDIISAHPGQVTGWHHSTPADRFPVTHTFDRVQAEDYAALVLPGGVVNADNIRRDEMAQELVRDAARADKPIAAICHGPWLLISADLVKGKRITSWPSLRTDLENAGAEWLDEPVVVDGHLISSRKPADLAAFNQALIEALR